MSLAEHIEAYLLDRGDWVPDIELARIFGIRERQLRALDGKPGLCSAFAISSDAGMKHVAIATTQEWLRFKHRLRRHGINEMVRVRELGRRRQSVTRSTRAAVFEKDTGQALLQEVLA